jgi:hypothetical protein
LNPLRLSQQLLCTKHKLLEWHKTQDRTFNDSKYDSFVNKQKSKPKTPKKKKKKNSISYVKKLAQKHKINYKIKSIMCSKISNH